MTYTGNRYQLAQQIREIQEKNARKLAELLSVRRDLSAKIGQLSVR